MKQLFLPVDIQHSQCPCRFFNLRGIRVMMWLQNYATEMLHCNSISRVGNEMSVIAVDKTGTTYTFYQREKTRAKAKQI